MNIKEAVAANAAMARLVSMMTPVNSCAKNALQNENVPGAACLRFRVLPCSQLLLSKHHGSPPLPPLCGAVALSSPRSDEAKSAETPASFGVVRDKAERRENRSGSVVNKRSELIALNRVLPRRDSLLCFLGTWRALGPCNSLGSPHPLLRNVQPSGSFFVRLRLLA